MKFYGSPENFELNEILINEGRHEAAEEYLPAVISEKSDEGFNSEP